MPAPEKEKWLNATGCGSSRDCTNKPTEEPHACPFSCEIYDDDSDKCTCCEECTQECVWDV